MKKLALLFMAAALVLPAIAQGTAPAAPTESSAPAAKKPSAHKKTMHKKAMHTKGAKKAEAPKA